MTVRQEIRGRVLVATIDREEKRNALNPATIAALGDAFLAAEANDDVRVMILTGAGDRAFCAGMDLTGVGAARTEPTVGSERYRQFLTGGIRKPLIAAVNGFAVAGGFELALSCDLVVAADHARFGLPEVKRGLFAGAGGTMLPLRIPMAIALEIGLTGDQVSASRAYELGLVNRVVPGANVLDEALALADAIAVNAPNAVEVTKRLMYETSEVPLSVAWQNVSAALPAVLEGDEAKEGATAFLERRPPRWAE